MKLYFIVLNFNQDEFIAVIQKTKCFEQNIKLKKYRRARKNFSKQRAKNDS